MVQFMSSRFISSVRPLSNFVLNMKCSTVVKHCCFCVDHAEGVKVLAILSLFECVGFAIASGVYAEKNYSKSVGLFSLLIFLIIFFIFLFAASIVLLLAIFKQRRELFVPWFLLYGLKIMVEFAFILIYSVVVFQPMDIYYHMWEFMLGSLAMGE